ncbi:MAG: hypothetical protein AB1806_18115 [Acidobacteriota bacterium]
MTDEAIVAETTGGWKTRLAHRVRAWLGVHDLREDIRRVRQESEKNARLLREIDARVRSVERHTARFQDVGQTQMKDVRLRLNDVGEHLQEIRSQLGSRGVPHLLKLLRLDTRALLRRALLDPATLPYPQRLTAQRASVTSQREEDGISWAIFQHAGATTRRFIDIGSGMNGGISGFYARECGWSGLMIDAKEAHVAVLKDRFSPTRVTSIAALVTRDNVNGLVVDAGFDGEVDLLSIDVDGMDYWIWHALTASSPRLVVIEYNALFGFRRAVTLPYEAMFDRTQLSGALRKRYYGASLPALMALAAKKGYRLVTVEPNALNAFFLRDDVAPDIPGCLLEDLPYSEVENSRFEDIYGVIAQAHLPLVEVDG